MAGLLLRTVAVLFVAVGQVRGECPQGWTPYAEGCTISVDGGEEVDKPVAPVLPAPLSTPPPPPPPPSTTPPPPPASPFTSAMPVIPGDLRSRNAPCLNGWNANEGSCKLSLEETVDGVLHRANITAGHVMQRLLSQRVPVPCGQPAVPSKSAPFARPVGPAKPLADMTKNEAFPGSWPWTASILVKFAGGARKHCSGTLLSREWVLTAADCIFEGDNFDRRIQVRLGVHDLREVLPAEVRREVTDINVHPDYSPSSKDNNLALLRLSSPVPFTSLVMPACLPSASFKPLQNARFVTVGWDRPEFPTQFEQSSATPAEPVLLQQATLDLTDAGGCTRPRGSTAAIVCAKRSDPQLWQQMVGDPLFHFNARENFLLYGMAGYSAHCSTTANCPFFAISPYISWITTTVGVLPLSTECGKPAVQPMDTPPMKARIIGSGPTTRIAFGTTANPNSWPWQVSIYIPHENGPYGMCGGSLIDEQWVISAAQCFYTPSLLLKQVQIRLGAYNLYSEAAGEQRRYPVQVFMRMFDPNQEAFGDDDVVLIKLNSPVSFSASIRPICLPERDNEVLVGGDKVFATGWGSTEADEKGGYQALREVETAIFDFNQCRVKYGDVVTENMICAGNLKGDAGVCKGDTGGPLVYQTADGTFYLVGIISWSQGCAQVGYPDVFTRVSRYRDWIRTTVGY